MSVFSSLNISSVTQTITAALNPVVLKAALIPSIAAGLVSGIAIYKMVEGATLNEGRTLLTGYVAGGIALSVDEVLPDVGGFDEVGSILLGGTAAGVIVNASFGAVLPVDTDANGTVTDAEKLASYEAQFTPITQPQQLRAAIVAGVGIALASYFEIARAYHV